MVIGVDMGASALKICGIENGELAFTHYESGRQHDVPALLRRLGIEPQNAKTIALTGLVAERCGLSDLCRDVRRIPEPAAIGAGAVSLSGRDNILVASIGTGTAFVHAKNGEYAHICGTGVGGGTLHGLAERLLGVGDMGKLNAMAMEGSAGAVDLLIGDFTDGYGQLDPNLTASNLARLNPSATEEDWAAGITNLVLQVVGTMSLLAARGCGAEAVVVTGAMAASAPSVRNFELFTSAYGMEYLIPPHSDCATAIGAARLAL